MPFQGPTTISLAAPRSLTKAELEDVQMCLENVMNAKSFFYAGSDDVADDIVRFLAERQILANLEEVIEG